MPSVILGIVAVANRSTDISQIVVGTAIAIRNDAVNGTITATIL